MLHPIGKLLGQMEDASNGMSLAIIDVCRKNQFYRNFFNTDQELAQEIAPADSFISYATASDEVVSDEEWTNGTFAKLLAHQNLFAR